jgi:hypothetical protein
MGIGMKFKEEFGCATVENAGSSLFKTGCQQSECSKLLISASSLDN